MANAFLFRPRQWASITASGTASGFDVNDLSPWPVPRMGRVWRAPSGSTAGLVIDLGADQEIDTLALFGIGNGNAVIGNGWEWQVNLATAAQGSGFGGGAFWSSGWAPFAVNGQLPESLRAKHLWLAPDGAPDSARYVRLLFQNLGSAQLQIALATVGKRFQPSRNYSYGAALGVRDLGSLDYSPRGVVAQRPGAKRRGFGLTFNALRKDEVEGSLQRLFEQVGNTDPVVLVTDPANDLQLQNRIGIGHLTGNLGSVHRVPGFFQAEVNFVAVD